MDPPVSAFVSAKYYNTACIENYTELPKRMSHNQ